MLIGLFFIIKAIIQFYKLINAINHEVIFDWMNVRRLNRIGRNLLISFILTQSYPKEYIDSNCRNNKKDIACVLFIMIRFLNCQLLFLFHLQTNCKNTAYQ